MSIQGGTMARALSVWVVCLCLGQAQDGRLAEILTDPGLDARVEVDRAEMVRRLEGVERGRLEDARARARVAGLPLRRVVARGGIHELAGFDAEGKPVYLATCNANAAISTGATPLWTSPYGLSGSGVVIGLWDEGAPRATHRELIGRVNIKDGSAAADHSTHVGGTLIASGVVSAARGMAGAAVVDAYEWTFDTTEMASRAASAPVQAGKIHLSNHSYGYLSGWTEIDGGTPYRRWEWNGAGTTSTSIETDFGLYNSYARESDALAVNYPYYLMFRAAGNERTDNPASGQMVALSPGSTTVVAYNPATHPAGDGSYRGGFDTISHNALAKNVITVGSVTDAVNGSVRDPSRASISSFSSWGPTDDGRIKPDVVANGQDLYSPVAGGDAAYATYSGTSMATPNACGSAALLVESYGKLFPGGAMRSSTLKGLLIHTADDRGNPGPDYKFGWGLVNVKAAADLLRDHQANPVKQRLTEGQITTSLTTRTVSFLWDGVSPITATLCWTDPAGNSTTTSDSRTRRLMNDLNLKVLAPDGVTHLPYVMPFVGTWTQASMDLPAVTGVNTVDNVEQVRIAAPAVVGTYQVVVSYAGTLYNNNSQYFSLLVSGASAEPPPLVLSAVTPGGGYANGTTVLTLSGSGLRSDTTVKLVKDGQSAIAATGVQMSGEDLTCRVDLTGAVAGAWDVVATGVNGEVSVLPAAFAVSSAIWSESFDGTVSGWTSQTVTGTNSWSLSTVRAHTRPVSYFAPGPNRRSTAYLISPAVAVPAGATDVQLKFWHQYTLEARKDGGRLELSVDGGAWFDVVSANSGVAFASNGYVNTISSTSSDFPNLPVWNGTSGGFIETVVNFTNTAKFAGKSLRMRWGLATNNSVSSIGWNIDSVALIAGGNLTNKRPEIVVAATSGSLEVVTDPDLTVHEVLRGSGADLSVGATDDGGEEGLIYTWSLLDGPGDSVVFGENGTHVASATSVEFSGAGDYHIGVEVKDAEGLTAGSTVRLRVLQTASGLEVVPIVATVPVGSVQPFQAVVTDQFADPMAVQPGEILWSVSGGGTITSQGVFVAEVAGGPYTVMASAGGFANTSSVTVTRGKAEVSLGGLEQVYDGEPRVVTVTTEPAGLAVEVTYDGSSEAPVAAGTYQVVATVVDANYEGSTQGAMVVSRAAAEVSLGGLEQVYDGKPRVVTVTTEPAGLAVEVTYDGSSEVPVAAGTYQVVATVVDANYEGLAQGVLVVVGDPWLEWTHAHFNADQVAAGWAEAGADPDGDGRVNLLEYALGGNPVGVASVPVVWVRPVTEAGFEVPVAMQCAVLVRAGVPEFVGETGLEAEWEGCRYRVEGSHDLAIWDLPVAVDELWETGLPEPPAGYVYRCFRVACLEGAAWFRVRVIR